MAEEMSTAKWQEVLDGLKGGGAGPYFFPVEGKTRIRLIPAKGTKDQFFAETKRVYQGKERSRYLITGLVVGADGKDLDESAKSTIVPIVIPVTALRGILSLLAEGYDLLSPKEGHGVTIIRSGKGLETAYNVTPTPKAVPIDPATLTWPDASLQELATQFYTASLERDSERKNKGSEKGEKKEGSGHSEGGDW